MGREVGGVLYEANRPLILLGLLPQAKSTAEGALVVAQVSVFRQTLQPPGIAAAEYHVVGLQGMPKRRHHILHTPAPLPHAAPLEPAQADVIFVRSALPIP